VCFRKNGFPQNYEGKNLKNYVKKTCTHCGRNGHTVDVCYRNHGFPTRHKFFNGKANSIKVTDNKHEVKQESAGSDQDMRLTQQHFQTLLALLRSKEENAEDPHVNQINTITDLSQLGKPFIGSYTV